MPMVARLKNNLVDLIIVAAVLIAAGLALLRPELLYQYGPPCLITLVFGPGVSWGCGMTHATVHLLQGDFQAAYDHNKLVFIVAPLLAALSIRYFIRVWQKTAANLFRT
ncbi:MAG: DUF2752 domain-containing protein [Alphaproteobacteria bacterium]|nr:DUF2752 domain-containing protein [Alphaproteobacteria bacterium]